MNRQQTETEAIISEDKFIHPIDILLVISSVKDITYN
jgi:hypothetical protein